jgi:hypothetical protein
MRITAFWARGYRSLVDVRLDDLGQFNVFYGPNGAGKSNILAAMRVFFELLARSIPISSVFEKAVEVNRDPKVVHDRDRCQLERAPVMVLGARLIWAEGEEVPAGKPPGVNTLTVEITFGWERGDVRVSRLEADGVDLVKMRILEPNAEPWASRIAVARFDGASARDKAFLHEYLGLRDTEMGNAEWHLREFIRDVAGSAFTLVDADRVPRLEQASKGHKDITELLSAGQLKEVLLRASKHPDPAIRRRYKQLGALLEGPPFRRPPFEMTEDPRTGRIELVETVADASREARDIPIDLAGLGVAQIYFILARTLLGNTRAAGIEEPEAHLHAPTSGIHLRQLLERLVGERYLDQLFIATHSNLFDLDPTGYFDVSLDERGATRVERKQGLSEIDLRHLYEPGPAKHALADFLSYMDADTVVFRRSDGGPVSAGEMLDMLQRDDPVALEFLRDVHGAAVRAVRVKHKNPSSGASQS